MSGLPHGTVTFLLSDVEGSTAHWERDPEAMRLALARHDVLFEETIRRHGGSHIRPRGEGDSRFAVFPAASDALDAALAIQRSFAAETWPTPRPISVRIGIHTGEAELRDGDYYGLAVNRCARIRAIGHGGQILLSGATARLVADRLPAGTSLLDHGEHRLKDLTVPEHVFQLAAPDLPVEDAPLASLDPRRHNLPVQPAALLGREHEVAEIRALLLRPDVRLLTLTGAGGTGKSRLSLQVAAELTDHFEDGVYLVALGPIVDPALVPSTIAQALDVRDSGGRPVVESLAVFLRDRHLLLVLDNFEQLLPAGLIVAELLMAAPRLKILVTSRAPLQIRGEHELSVSPLAFPTRGQVPPAGALRQYPAVALFVERVQAVHPEFVVSDENAEAVAEVCARLDGLPLAIELAAARARTLSPKAMVRRLERRLPLLTGGARDLPTRQQTLRDAIAWSYDLLTPEEQTLFRRLGVFAGGFTLDAAERVASSEGRGASEDSPLSSLAPRPSSLDLLDSLSAQSLVLQRQTADGEPRFAMLETIREYALERLDEAGELDAIRQEHAAYFLALAEEAEPHLRSARQTTWLRRLDPEHDNLRAALAWSRDSGEAETGLRIAVALCWFWAFRGHVGEGRSWLADLIDLSGGVSRARARARALLAAGTLAIFQADYAVVRALGRGSADLFDVLGDRSGIGSALTCVGIAELGDADIAAARPVLEEAVAACREAENRWGLAQALSQLASVFRQDGDLPGALALREEAAVVARELGDRWVLGMALMGAATIVRGQGDLSRSTALYREALVVLRELEDRWLTPRAIDGLAGCAVLDADHLRAARLFGAAAALREASGTREMSLWRVAVERDVADLQAAMGDLAFTTAWAEGRAMGLEEVIAYALDDQQTT